MRRICRNPLCLYLLLALSLLQGFAVPSASCAQQIVLNALGDIMLAGGGTGTYKRMGYDYPFASTRQELKNGDITVGNLEAPITRTGTEFTGKKFRFKTSPRAAQALRRAGFSVLTLANNHMLDFGSVGLEETRKHLERAGILYTGAGKNLAIARKPALVYVKGKRVAFLAYSLTLPPEFFAEANRPGTVPGFTPYFREDIAQAKLNADYVIVSFHWGAEKAVTPKPYQIIAARRAVDAGADVVIGHHPHVLQGIERYRNGIIFYSLGNFAFGSTSRSSDISVLARITLGSGIREVEVIPLNVLNSEVRFQPKVLKGERGLAVIRRLNSISGPLGTEIRLTGKRYLAHRTGVKNHLAQR
ncbi:MAG: putative enzyme of poly-gamma-glutamate biosynthesis (capsule formation)-like protein [Geobacteraceae bacterium]|nr:putative enzyme of poly-gamma-glutamate biosynthesis (capsule formation)-like protein [Geobacteraceae bacterium]